MKILVYSAMNAATVQQNFGEPEYSYYFVLREFMPLLQQLGAVQLIEDPATEVDALYQQATNQGQACLFLSFSPPHLTCLGLACPTIPVFAWEFSSMPDETWWEDRPEQDWRWCLQQCQGAIVHSQQSADAVRKLMGPDFSVVAMPAPLWDRMTPVHRQTSGIDNDTIGVSRGVVFDTHDHTLTRWLPTEQDVIRAVAEARGLIPASADEGFRRGRKSAARITLEYLVAWYQQVWSSRVSPRFRAGLDHWAARHDPWQPGRRTVQLNGVVFTSLFNPLDGRKNWVDMLTAFCTEFRDEPDATLVFKLGHRRHEEAIQHLLMVIPKLGRFRCRVIIISGFLDNDAYLDLIRQSHFAVNTSHGEGQCLPLMEYLACGKPAVAPRHSALADYIDEKIAFIVDSSADATAWPHDPRIAYRTLRQQIDWSSLSRAFRAAYECYRDQPELYQQMSKAAIERMHQHCSINTAKARLNTFLPLVLEQPVL